MDKANGENKQHPASQVHFLFEGKAGALAVLLSHEIKKGSGKVLENGVTQIEMGVL